MSSRDAYVGLRIIDARILRGVEADELAAQVGVSSADLERIERGEIAIPAALLARIAQVLNCPLSYFFAGFEAGK